MGGRSGTAGNSSWSPTPFRAIPSREPPCYGAAMGQERVEQAIGRIERALARLEAAADRPPAIPQTGEDSQLSDLRRAHRALRGKVEGTIAQIDRLLATEEGG
jgi:hypothetical protein